MTMNQYSRRPVELTEAGRAKILATLRGETTAADRGTLEALRGETPAQDRGILERLHPEDVVTEGDRRILETLRGETPIDGAQVLQDDAVQEARASAPRQSSVRKNVRITKVAGR